MQEERILAELARIAKVTDIPDFVKNASLDEVIPESVPPELCADGAGGRLPCHTKSATWMSAVRYAMSGEDNPIITKRLAEFVEMHGIADDVARALNPMKKLATAAKSPETFYAYEDPERGIRAFPIPSPRFIKNAVDLFRSEFGEMPFSVRHQVAFNILKRAKEFGVELDPDTAEVLEKSAGVGVSAKKYIATGLLKRAYLIQTQRHGRLKPIVQRLKKMAETVLRSNLSKDALVKMAELVDVIDRKLNLRDAVGHVEDTFFALSPTMLKAAREKMVKLADGSVFVEEDFKRLNLKKVARVFGEEAAKYLRSGLEVDVAKARKFAESLKPSDVELLKECFDG